MSLIRNYLKRRDLILGILAAPLLLSRSNAFAESASAVNDIIKDLAPIAGQTHSGGYQHIHREPVEVERGTIYVDLGRHVEIEVFFEYDSARITGLARHQLGGLGEALSSSALSQFRYLIAGHTDATGSDSYNIDLSRRRAAAVRSYLVEAFPVRPENLLTAGFGYHRLRNPEQPHAAINRRVEILLIVD